MSDIQTRPEGITSRLLWPDIAKGLLILLVVFGHALSSMFSSGMVSEDSAFGAVKHWIYLFHMPAFFALAGLFLERSASRSAAGFLTNKVQTILWPYLLWSVIQTSLMVVMAGHTNHRMTVRDVLMIPAEPVMQFWFLYALFGMMVLYLVLHRLGLPRWGIVAAGGLTFAAWASRSVPLGHWSMVPQVFSGFWCLALGVALAPRLVKPCPRDEGGALLLLAALAAMTSVMGAWITWPAASPWQTLPMALPGIVAACALAGWLGRSADGRVARWLAYLGRQSLVIYVAHSICSAAVRIGLIKVVHTRDPMTHLVLMTVAGVVGPLVMAWMCDRIGFRYAFAWPSRHPTLVPAARSAARAPQSASDDVAPPALVSGQTLRR